MGLFDDDSDAQGYLQQALQQYQNVGVPTEASEEVNNLPQETVQGTINPEQETAVLQGANADNNISLDPSSRAAQETALGGYQDIANAGGLDANAKLGIQQATDAANEQSQGAQGAIMQAAQAEGQGGGLNALALRSIAAQGASNTAAATGQQNAAEAEANREAALTGMSTIGSNIENSDYTQAQNKATDQNAINASNTATQNNVNNVNVGNNLTAQGANVANAQGVNAANTTANQSQAYYNANLPQQQFNNELAKASGAAGVNQAQAGAAQSAQNSSNAATGQLIGGGLTLAGTALGGPLGGAVANKLATPKAPGMSDGGVACYAKGGEAHNHFLCMLGGGPVPGEAEVEGDSPANDIVPARLSPGEGVIKRSDMADPKKAAKAAEKISMEAMVKGYNKSRKK